MLHSLESVQIKGQDPEFYFSGVLPFPPTRHASMLKGGGQRIPSNLKKKKVLWPICSNYPPSLSLPLPQKGSDQSQEPQVKRISTQA